MSTVRSVVEDGKGKEGATEVAAEEEDEGGSEELDSSCSQEGTELDRLFLGDTPLLKIVSGAWSDMLRTLQHSHK
jgi:hypothetical protein